MSLIVDAFKELTALNEQFLAEDTFPADEKGFEALKNFEEENEDSEEVIEVIDYNIDDTLVDSEDSDNYVGKVILDCNICHSKIYEDPANVVVSEEGVANADMECPYCSVTDGFTVVGEITEFDKDEETKKSDDDDDETEEAEEKDDKELDEGINNLSIETDDTKMEMTSDEDGKVVVTTEPVSKETEEPELKISEVSDETKDEILNNTGDEEFDETEEESTEENIDEIVEESFNRLGESYLKKVYNNVKSFNLTEAATKGNRLFLEGVIRFNSGKTKKTSFIFEAHSTDGNAYKFIGSNKEITNGKKAFTLVGSLNEGVLTCNRMNYKYYSKALNESKVSKIYGTVKLTEAKKDLSTIDGTTTKVLSDNISDLNALKSKEELVDKVVALFDEHGLKSKGAVNLINTLKSAKNLTDAQSALFNSILAGSGLAVLSNKNIYSESLVESILEAISPEDQADSDLIRSVLDKIGNRVNARLTPEEQAVLDKYGIQRTGVRDDYGKLSVNGRELDRKIDGRTSDRYGEPKHSEGTKSKINYADRARKYGIDRTKSNQILTKPWTYDNDQINTHDYNRTDFKNLKDAERYVQEIPERDRIQKMKYAIRDRKYAQNRIDNADAERAGRMAKAQADYDKAKANADWWYKQDTEHATNSRDSAQKEIDKLLNKNKN